jgi:16S rRNA (guanine1207-N2)-methyltransferase
MSALDLIYGIIPPKLDTASVDQSRLHQSRGARLQASPLMPGSTPLETLGIGQAASLTMLAPPNAVERRHDMALALRALGPGAPFTILAPKDKGGTRLARELQGFGLQVLDTPKSHHRICTGVRADTLTGVEQAIADGAPRLLPQTGLWSQPGLFSWDRLDDGTRLLIEHLPGLTGHGIDLGCGNGALARAALARAALAQAGITALVGLDLDRRAVELAVRNIGDPRFSAVWADVRQGLPSLQDGSQDFVIMNPPFHSAGHEDQGLGITFINRAQKLLAAGGKLVMVANRHLPYEAALKAQFKAVSVVFEGQGFKIHEAIK